MSKRTVLKPMLRALSLVLTAALLASACGSSDGTASIADATDAATEATAVPVATTAPVAIPAAEPTEAAVPAATAAPAPTAAPASTESTTESTTEDATADAPATAATATTGSASVDATGLSCDSIAARFVTKGSANADLADPQVAATCAGDSVVVTSNQIPDFPYIETSPGRPQEYDLEFTIPVTPVLADATSEIAKIGPIAVAINGIPIYAATEGPGGDVRSAPSGFVECGGHNGPTGYHYHLFDVNGSDSCLFSEAEASASPVLFGYAFDGFPIYGGNFFYTSSYELTDASLFAIDTFSAHTYVPGSGDLDECNGRTDENGNYAYYTTETFPYTLGCYAGVVSDANSVAGGAGPGGGGQGGPPPGDAAEGDAPAEGGAADRPAGPPADGEAPEGDAADRPAGPPADGEAPEGEAGPGGGGQGGGPDFSEAAATLGVSVEALEAALGQPPFDLDAAAATLGVTAAALEAAIPAPPGRPGG